MTFLLPFVSFGKTLFGAVAAWLSKRSLAEIICIAMGLALVVDHLALLASHRHAHKVETQLTKTVAARAADRAAYAKAQADAAAANLAHNAADKVERERITNDVSQSYQAQLASLRADLARRLHAQPIKGAPGQSGLPNVSPAPSGLDGGSRLSVPSSLYVRGAELELQLEQLQRWVNEQVKVDPNKPANSTEDQ